MINTYRIMPTAGPEDLDMSLEDDADFALEGEESGDGLLDGLDETEASVNLEAEESDTLLPASMEH